MLNAEIKQLRELDYTNGEIVEYFQCYDTIEDIKQAIIKDIKWAIEARENYIKGDIR